jgi:hypothetical protein
MSFGGDCIRTTLLARIRVGKRFLHIPPFLFCLFLEFFVNLSTSLCVWVIARCLISKFLPLFLQGVFGFPLGSLLRSLLHHLLHDPPCQPTGFEPICPDYRSRRNARVDPIALQRLADGVGCIGEVANPRNEAGSVQQVVVCPVGAVGVYLIDGVIPCVAIQVRVATGGVYRVALEPSCSARVVLAGAEMVPLLAAEGCFSFS